MNEEKEIDKYLKIAGDVLSAQSAKASDLLRKIATGFIAMLWSSFFLKEVDVSRCVLFSITFVALYFAMDVLQYFITSNRYDVAHDRLNTIKKGIDDDQAIKIFKSDTKKIRKTTKSFYIGKLIALSISVFLFVYFLFSTYS